VNPPGRAATAREIALERTIRAQLEELAALRVDLDRLRGERDVAVDERRMAAALSSIARTTCAACLEHKWCPWRDDALGYICAGCLAQQGTEARKERDGLRAALAAAELGRQLWFTEAGLRQMEGARRRAADTAQALERDSGLLAALAAEKRRADLGEAWADFHAARGEAQYAIRAAKDYAGSWDGPEADKARDVAVGELERKAERVRALGGKL
jgi:hypothetical protein